MKDYVVHRGKVTEVMRGMLTEEVKAMATELLGIELTVRQLRLMPYIDYVIKNEKRLANINDEEEAIVIEWVTKGFIIGSRYNLSVSKKFYDAMQEILWIAYVDYKDRIQE